jgi:pimeloyl-[acyl-carrier protein] methyl ester esterase
VARIPPILVCLPGLDGTGTLFDDFLAEVALGWERIVVRYPPHLSSYDDLVPVVEAAMPEWPRVILIAESFSTPIAIKIAARASGNLRGLVLCAGFASSPLRGVTRFLASAIAPILFKREPSESAVKFFLTGRDSPKHLTTAVREAVRRVPPAVLAGRLKQVLSCDVRAELSNIYRPILCVRAKRDRLVRSACTQEILRVSRDARLVEFDGPHLILQRQPRLCEQAIADFIHDL